MLNLLGRHYHHHPRMGLRFTHINIGDTRMWIDAAYKTDIQHPRSPDIADILPLAGFRREIKGACRAYSNAPDIRADILSRENFCTHDVAGLEAFHPFGLFGPSSHKAVLVHAAHLPRA